MRGFQGYLRALCAVLGVSVFLFSGCDKTTIQTGYSTITAYSTLSPVLESLLHFHPGWVTRSITSHDPSGGNGDGSGRGLQQVSTAEGTYQTLFHARGEGRILRFWMTVPPEDLARDYKELWIQLDGQTVYRGSPLDYFSGKGPFKSPVVMAFDEASGSYLSYAPFAYSHEAKILFKGDPHYYQVTYREGPGSSVGPNAAEVAQFMSENWWDKLETTFQTSASKASPVQVASGPLTVTSLILKCAPADLKSIKVRVGRNDAVPASFFFGQGVSEYRSDEWDWPTLHSAITYSDRQNHEVATRLPIPLQNGEALTFETESEKPVSFSYGINITQQVTPNVHFTTQYRDQRGPGTETTMPFFTSDNPTQFVSLVEEISDGPRANRLYLEGDEMIRTDAMIYPLQLGTGTEDYFNGGWYFLGEHSNPFAGQHRMVVREPEDEWKHALFEHSVYRHHVLDPIVSRQGLRFGFEAGELGSFTPIRYRTLGLAYSFDSAKAVRRTIVALNKTKLLNDGTGANASTQENMTSAIDAERAQTPQKFRVRYSRGRSNFKVYCPAGKMVDGVFLTRSYDAKAANQYAVVRVNGRQVGELFEAYANQNRRFAQNGLWIDLNSTDCNTGFLNVEMDATTSTERFSEIGYQATFYQLNTAAVKIKQTPARQIFDTDSINGEPHYINDHSFIQGDDNRWHVFGIFHKEPLDPENEIQFVHGTTNLTNPTEWREGAFQMASENSGIALERDASIGEKHLWAPHVVRDGNRYVMVYQSGGEAGNRGAQIRLAESKDLNSWQRVSSTPLFEDICVARDPMLKKFGNTWVIYYTRCTDSRTHHNGVAYRTSQDLKNWSEPQMALSLNDRPALANSGYTESPFVFERDGWFYLSVTSYPIDYLATFLYRSRSPFLFPSTEVARLQAHAPEWIEEQATGNLYMSHSGWGQHGLWISQVTGI